MPSKQSILPLLSLLLHLLPAALALTLSRTYDHGPIAFDETADLHFTIDLTSSTAYLAVSLTDRDIVTTSSNWIGVGISEPSAGSMIGSDIATAQFASGATDKCTLVDRHVPFAAYPLVESVANATSVFPDADTCQEDGSWTLVRCERDPDTGEMMLEVSRPLKAHDVQDRDIPPGLNNVIYAYGAAFANHGSRRRSVRVGLYSEDGDDSLIGAAAPELPDDVDGSILLSATQYKVPAEKVTVYACTSKVVRLEPGEKRMIVAAEPVLNSTDTRMVHHLTLFLCSSEEYAKKIENTVECTTADNGIPGPLGSPEARCATFVFAYAKGTQRLVLPREAGILIDDKDYVLVMETHYDNPDLIDDNLDSSGVRVYYTNTLRENEAGSLLMGDSLVSRYGEVVKNDFEYEHTCPSECTRKFSRPVNLYASFLHMHTTGRQIYHNRFDEDGEFVETINSVNFWSDSFQNYIVFDPPKQIRPGDQLGITCVYDTRKRPNTTWGEETLNEMCMEFAGYWPVQRDPETGQRINICSFGEQTGEDGTKQSFTVCGDSGMIGPDLFLPVPNPKFEDTTGSPETFGNDVGTCELPSVTDAPDEGDSDKVPAETDNADADGGTSGEGSGPDANTGGTATQTPAPSNEPACFPASATVSLASGGTRRMDELQVGDVVHTGRNEYSRVFMFTHRYSFGMHTFVRLETARRSLTVSPGHLIYANGILVAAKEVSVGDDLRVEDGGEEAVLKRTIVQERGLYNPHTTMGDVCVDGVIVSCYTTEVAAVSAHALLTPLRAMFGVFRGRESISIRSI